MAETPNSEKKQLQDQVVGELGAIQALALAGEQGDVDAAPAFNEIAQRLSHLAKSVRDLSAAK